MNSKRSMRRLVTSSLKKLLVCIRQASSSIRQDLHYTTKVCALCRLPIETPDRQHICHYCLQALPYLEPSCALCALPSAHSPCPRCRLQPPPWARLICVLPYQPPVDRFILNLKFYEQLTYAAVLGETMADYLSRYTLTDIDYLLPVPLSAQRFKQRGFNQALEIARPIARALQLPLGDQLVKRLRHTPAQSDLPAKDRSKNIRNAFAADPRLAGKSVVIIDDVMTTGSTLRSLCAALSAVGVARIEVWCCARALKV